MLLKPHRAALAAPLTDRQLNPTLCSSWGLAEPVHVSSETGQIAVLCKLNLFYSEKLWVLSLIYAILSYSIGGTGTLQQLLLRQEGSIYCVFL